MAKLGEMLLKESLVSREQLLDAMDAQRGGTPLGQVLVQRGIISEEQLVDVLARQTGYPKFTADPQTTDPVLAKLVPMEVAARLACAPLMLTGQVLTAGLLDPENERAVDQLAQLSGKTVKACVISGEAIREVWKHSTERRICSGHPVRRRPCANGICRQPQSVLAVRQRVRRS